MKPERVRRFEATRVGALRTRDRATGSIAADAAGLAEPAHTRGALASRLRGARLRRLLALADWTGLMAGVAVAYWSVLGADAAPLLWGALLSPAWILVAKLHGLYDNDHRRIRHSTVDELTALLSTAVFGSLVMAALLALTPAPALAATDVAALGAVAFVVSTSLRGVTRRAWRSWGPRESLALVGSGPEMLRLARRLSTHPETHLAVVGYFGEELPEDQGEWPGIRPRFLGPESGIAAVSEATGLERIVVADESISREALSGLIADCKRYGLSLTMAAPHGGLLGPGIMINRLAELPLLDFGFSDPPRSTELLKRAMDVFLSAAMLVLFAPVFVFLGVMIRLDSPGSALFRQVRVGKGGRPFTMLKFRTMVDDAESRVGELVDFAALTQPSFKIPDDPRQTRVGRRLRRFSLDELPQLWHVLMGEMSLVGPRPEEEAVVALYTDEQRVRLAVKPGLTGPMQVYGRGDLTFDERLSLERDYLDNLSITRDLAILLRTPRAVASGIGAY